MSVRPAGDELHEAERALEQAEWDEARRGFEAVLETSESPPAYEGLGLALWFLGRVADGIAARERAFELYAHESRCSDAARVAVWVSHQHTIAGRMSAARGWLARAERALTEVSRCAGHGWLAVEHARMSTSVTDQMRYARDAMTVARDETDRELEVVALSVLGCAEVSAGHRDAGMVLLEEAMAAASSGLVRNVHTLGTAYCNLIVACNDAGEWERAREWCELVDEFARSHESAPLLGVCRTIHADMLMATGHWPEAERALASAIALHARYIPELDAPTVATFAELRIRQGRLGDAAKLLSGREEQPSSLRALALLRIAEGQPGVGASLLERGLRASSGNAMGTTQLLSALVDARLAAGQVDAASTAADQLAGIAEDTGIRLVGARADLAAARVALASREPGLAVEPARKALAGFGALAMPLDAGEARFELARALMGESPELAAEEARAAYATFRGAGRGAGDGCLRRAAARTRRRHGRAASARRRADRA